MKKLITLTILAFSLWSNAQNGITYQAVILNPNSEELPGADNSRLPLVNQNVTLEFKILNANSLLDYQETINTQTDAYGMVNVVIGTGTRNAGIATQFSAINWDGSAKNLIVSLDPSGHSNHFIEISNQPFTYVPFALYAAHTGVAGTQGPAGNNGLDGKTVLNGTTNPIASLGTNGDFYINTASSSLFGPKTNGIWGSGVPLVGPQGIQGPQGIAGANGANGSNGLSAYQIWLNAGNTGTEAQFLTALRGATGAQGPQGIQGLQGPIGLTGATGSQGLAGTNGVNGTNGFSAYQIWLNAGNTGTEAQFLTALRGATGAQGPQGIQGIQGAAGTNGKNTLVNTTTEAAGANCANGGTKIEVGIDANSNGVLDSGEVNSSLTKYVCNGTTGQPSLSTNVNFNLSNIFLLNNTTTYTVPSGKSARISQILANSSILSGDRIISVNGTPIYLGSTFEGTINQTDDRIMWTSFLVNGEFWLPSGTTISILSNTKIGFLSIQETDTSNLVCYLVTNTVTVPNGKKWKISSILPNTNLNGMKDFVITINNSSVYVGASKSSAYYNAGASGNSYDILKNEIWLPEGSSISPGLNIYGISIIEY